MSMKIENIGAATLSAEGPTAGPSSTVRQVQRAINELTGRTVLAQTGVFDDATAGRLADFQRVKGLPPTGDIDGRTIVALNQELVTVAMEREADRSAVELCRRVAELPGNDLLGLEHWWIRTSTSEAGMGPDDGGVPGHGPIGEYPGMPTRMTDHRGEGELPESRCDAVEDLEPERWRYTDRECVEEAVTVNRDTGPWLPPVNDCHTVIEDVLDDCQRPPGRGRHLPPTMRSPTPTSEQLREHLVGARGRTRG